MKIHTSIGRTILLVDDYEKALQFYQQNFFCQKLFDSTSFNGKRTLHIAFAADDDLGIWLLKAETPEQQAAIGNQTAGQPLLVIYTDHIENLYDHLSQNKVHLLGPISIAPGSKYFHCLDLYGNKLTLLELLT